MKDKPIVITEAQLTLLHQGNVKDFILNMIKIGIKIGSSGDTVESFKGPFKDDDTSNLLFVARLQGEKE